MKMAMPAATPIIMPKREVHPKTTLLALRLPGLVRSIAKVMLVVVANPNDIP
ncbi:hypothetical protein SDC9_105425 [bioreactor metagenome]|uniref:Uncharacterized protein n=1 Tax=bioreactor metagenome TaxID=1076179 RepID=A0A645BA84_9ZZZZ